MSKDNAPRAPNSTKSKMASNGQDVAAPAISKGISRRGLLAGAAVGSVTAASIGLPAITSDSAMQAMAHGGSAPGKRKGERIILRNCMAVLTMDPKADMAGADIIIQDGKIVAITKSSRHRGYSGREIDCSTLIAVPGFVTTHHHKHQTAQRSADADGYASASQVGVGPGQPEGQKPNWPYERYGILQNLWSDGRLTDIDGNLWDLGRPAIDPDDVYIAELVASIAELKAGVTCATDTSQASHTPQHTDAMIKGLMDSGQRGLYVYSGGLNRAGFGHATEPNGYEFPGTIGSTKWGVGRLRKKFFSSDDQLVTLALNVTPTPVTNVQTGAVEPYTGWELAKHFGVWINSHNLGNPSIATHPLMGDPEIGPKNTQVHCVRWNDVTAPQVQIGANKTGYPNPGNLTAWQAFADQGGHVSIAVSIEMEMRHGRPPISGMPQRGHHAES